MKNNKGLSLIEVLIIIAIVGIMAAIAVPEYFEYKNRVVAEKIVKEGKAALTEGEQKTYSINKAEIDRYVKLKVEKRLSEEMEIMVVLKDTVIRYYREVGKMPLYRDISYTLHENLAKNGLAEAFRNSKSIFLVPNDPPVYMALGNIDILEDADESFAKIIEDLGTAAQESSSEYVFTTYAIYKEQHVILTVLLLAWVYPFAEGGETDFRITSFIIVR